METKLELHITYKEVGGESLTYVKMYNFCSFEILVCYLILKES